MTPSTISKLSMLRGGVELHDATEDEAVFVGAQAADIGRKLLRQHGDGAVGEVDAVAAEAGFEIERGAGQNVLRRRRRCGPATRSRRRGRVHARGQRRQNRFAVSPSMVTMGSDAEVGSAGGFGGIEMGDGAGFGEDGLGKDARQLVLADHHLHVDAEIVGGAEDLDDAAMGGRVGVGQLVISTSTTRPSALRAFRSWTGFCFTAQNAMRCR